MTEQEIVVDRTVTDAVRDRFTLLGQELQAMADPLPEQTGRVADGAGPLAGELARGLATFELSWRAALGASGESAGTIAANVGGLTLDLEAVDLDLTL